MDKVIQKAKDTTRIRKEKVRSLVDEIVSSPNGRFKEVFRDCGEDLRRDLARIIDADTGVFTSHYFARVRLPEFVLAHHEEPIAYAVFRAGDSFFELKDALRQKGVRELGLGNEGELCAVAPAYMSQYFEEHSAYCRALVTAQPPGRASLLQRLVSEELERQYA